MAMKRRERKKGSRKAYSRYHSLYRAHRKTLYDTMMAKRDFPATESGWDGPKSVCKRCHCVMQDIEPATRYGEYWHPTLDKEKKPHWCKNAGQMFNTTSSEIEPFMRKRDRRRLKRLNITP